MMAMPQLRPLPDAPDAIAPDLMEVRLLAGIAAGGMAHFRMPPRTVGRAVRHRTVEELWFFTAGAGRMWLATSATRRSTPSPSPPRPGPAKTRRSS
jgi:hypothetical protein